jgi:multidrug resistance efflux pump
MNDNDFRSDAHEARSESMRLQSKKTWLGIGLFAALAVCAALGIFAMRAWTHQPLERASSSVISSPDEEPRAASGYQITVKTIHPKRDPSFVLSIKEPAFVEPYFRADLFSRVAGPVKSVQKDIGDWVTRDEVLVEIDVPDVEQQLAQAEAVIEQRRAEEILARRRLEIAQAAAEGAREEISQKIALADQAKATMDFRAIRWNRFKGLAATQAVDKLVVEEEERDFLAAKAAYEGAKSAIKKAEANWIESKASFEAAVADVRLKQTMVEVARKDRDRVQAQVDYAKITAPFDGVIIKRDIDPGSFVHNAGGSSSQPLLSLARTDIVTVVIKVPDDFAPHVSTDTQASVEMDALPGVVINGKVTRFSPSVQNKDRTMRVEMDLYNGSEADYRKFLLRGIDTVLAPLGTSHLAEVVSLAGASRITWRQHRKGMNGFPLYPDVSGDGASRLVRLLPGMTGYMRLRLPCENAYLVPSGAVFSRGGQTYIAEVTNGIANLVRVEVQADDGSMAQVVKVARKGIAKGNATERIRKPLTGQEEIVVSGQGEIADGQAVKATPVEW